MGLSQQSAPSRWRLYLEARDCLREALAPALPLSHLLKNGARIARRTRLARPKRPRQIRDIARIISAR